MKFPYGMLKTLAVSINEMPARDAVFELAM